ncbi:hypothetical protein AnigIFM63326_002177, partial [Aspergillus niger]
MGLVDAQKPTWLGATGTGDRLENQHAPAVPLKLSNGSYESCGELSLVGRPVSVVPS